MENKKESELFRQKDYLGRNFLQRFLRNITTNSNLQQIEDFIARAKGFGLPETDVEKALISLDYNEPEDSFIVVAEQLFENNLKIDKEFYDLAMIICKTLKLDKQKYQFLRELIENKLA